MNELNMTGDNAADKNFIKKIDEIIEANLSDEKFTVPELASKLGMSRYTLHRKVNAATKLSVSQYIRQMRLKKAMKLLREKSLTISEVAFKVGFNSPIYFSKCFHEYYGHPPNMVGQRNESKDTGYLIETPKKRLKVVVIASVFLVVLAAMLFFIIKAPYSLRKNQEKSVVVLFPFNNNTDSVYLPQINGTIDAIVNNLSLIGDLTVFPISTSLKYKNSGKSGVDIAKELGASYVIETSGLLFENQIRFNVKLISAYDGVQIWYNPYDVKIREIITLPFEIAQEIAEEIHAEITPDEKKRIKSKPTQNNDAWDNYLKGRDMYNTGISLYYGTGAAGNTGNIELRGIQRFEEAIKYFKTAFEYDGNFALASAQIAITYYLLDIGKNEGKFTMEINKFADLAILNDSEHELCLLAKAYDYVNKGESKLAIPFLEKALKFNPKSVISYRLLADIYNVSREADTEKYLEYKLQVVKLTSLVEDNIQKSEDYRLAARALRVAGFYDFAHEYNDKSIELNPENYSAIGEKGEIIIEEEDNYIKAREILQEALRVDSSNLEIIRFLFTNHYLTREFDAALEFFKLYEKADKDLMFLAPIDYSRLATLYKALNITEEYEYWFKKYVEINRTRLNTYNKSNELIRLYSLENKKNEAIEQMSLLNEQVCHFSYTIRMLRDDPVYDNIRELPEFERMLKEMENKFQDNKYRIKNILEKKELL